MKHATLPVTNIRYSFKVKEGKAVVVENIPLTYKAIEKSLEELEEKLQKITLPNDSKSMIPRYCGLKKENK
jgi:hypothetical protein